MEVSSNTYTNILVQFYQPSLEKIFNNNMTDGVIFQEDNTSCHTPKELKSWCEKIEEKVIKLRPQSPGVNRIERLWSCLGSTMRVYRYCSKRELEAKLHKEWQIIEPTICDKLISNTQMRIKATLKTKRAHTNY